jgi:hypothetical protein
MFWKVVTSLPVTFSDHFDALGAGSCAQLSVPFGIVEGFQPTLKSSGRLQPTKNLFSSSSSSNAMECKMIHCSATVAMGVQ